MPGNPQKYAYIALPIPINKLFTYKIPPELSPTTEIGRRALVPFGKNMLTGFIIGITDSHGDVPLKKLKPISQIIDDEPVFDNHMIELAKWVSDYYVSSVGEVLKCAIPYGTMIKSRLLAHYVPQEGKPDISLTSSQSEVYDIIRDKGSVPVKTIARSLKENVSAIVRALEKKGLVRLKLEIDAPAVRAKTERHVVPVDKPSTKIPGRARQQKHCIEVLRKYPDGLPLSELLDRHGFSRGVVNTVVSTGFAYYEEVEITRRSKILDQDHVKVDHPLTSDQKESCRFVLEESNQKPPRPILLYGVTGSGKTRVYIELVKEMLNSGKSALILVPEISLTPQTTRFFSSVFPERVAVMHSAMSPGERHDMWRLIHDGICDVVIGPRSAVFAPLKSPGIIIVDEEHETSYKQTDTSPRYSARDTAVVRGHLLGIPVILGSATPSLETWQNAKSGKYALSILNKRVQSKPMPEVVTVDMRKERDAGNFSSISQRLREELTARIERGEKSILLMNRRGHSTSIQCKQCGYTVTCPNCSVGLTYHSSKGLALCHTCGHEQLVLEHCPVCGSTKLKHKGSGTQKIEKEIVSIAGEDGIVRMDSDTTRAHDGHFRLIEEFRKSAAPVLLGTQMIGKGLDFPEVTLVGIISADSSLFLPDFRAGERTFQLITQVAGRAGRGDVPGTVILQTFNPDNYAVESASKQDFDLFAEQELEARESADFPPFSRLILIELASESAQTVNTSAQKFTEYLIENVDTETEVMGPVDAPIPYVKGRHRVHILIKSPNSARARTLIRHYLENTLLGKETIDVDVDPVNLM